MLYLYKSPIVKGYVKNVARKLFEKKDPQNAVIRYHSSYTLLKPRKLITDAEEKEMMQYFPDIVKDLTIVGDCLEMKDLTNRMTDLLEYTVQNGSKFLGYSEVLAYKMLERPERLTKDNLKLANILGWCMELHTASRLIIDDTVDNSETRRGIPCWYKLPNIGMSAINDSTVLSQTRFILLKKYFSTHKYYVPMMDLMNISYTNFALGVILEQSNVNIKDITMERYLLQEKYKSCEYTFTVPVTLAIYLSDNYNEGLYRQCKNILKEMGCYFARENDIWDVFDNTSTTDRMGSDIQRGKCTWIIVTALQKANASQRKLLEEHHGKPQKESVELLRNVYEELDIPKEFFAYRDGSYRKMQEEIAAINHDRMRNCLYSLTERLYTRKYD